MCRIALLLEVLPSIFKRQELKPERLLVLTIWGTRSG